jgi:hypothetical protein
VDARLQDVIARLVLHDGRFAAMTDRLNQADRRADTFRARVDSGFATVDRRLGRLGTRLDAHDARHDTTEGEMIDAARRYRAALYRTTVLGLVVTGVASGVLAGGTVWLVR